MKDLTHEILYGTDATVRQAVAEGAKLNAIDEYGYSPLIEAVLMENPAWVKLLLASGADPNYTDVTDASPLYWAADAGHYEICEALFKKGADPNQYPVSRQPPLVYPLLRGREDLKMLFLDNGADLEFAKDYINTKLLAHRFEVKGRGEIAFGKGLVEIELEGFLFEFTLSLVQNQLKSFMRHYVARELKSYSAAFEKVTHALEAATFLRRFIHFTVDIKQQQNKIEAMLNQDLLIIPMAYEGHAITCVTLGDYFIKCDRGEHSQKSDAVVVFKMGRPEALTNAYIKDLIYGRHDYYRIHQQIEHTLQLRPYTTLPLTSQIVGNCSWANVEACLPASLLLFWIVGGEQGVSLNEAKQFIMGLYHRWREWDKDTALSNFIQTYQSYAKEARAQRAAKLTMMANILGHCLDPNVECDVSRAEKIIPFMLEPEFSYIFEAYIKVYCGAKPTEEGRRLRKFFEMLDFDFPKR